LPTYAVLGLASAFLDIAGGALPAPVFRLSARLVLALLAAGVVFLGGTWLTIRLFL
jgi:hypothetical protein